MLRAAFLVAFVEPYLYSLLFCDSLFLSDIACGFALIVFALILGEMGDGAVLQASISIFRVTTGGSKLEVRSEGWYTKT